MLEKSKVTVTSVQLKNLPKVQSCCWKFMISAVKCWEIKWNLPVSLKQVVNTCAITRVRPIDIFLSESEFKLLKELRNWSSLLSCSIVYSVWMNNCCCEWTSDLDWCMQLEWGSCHRGFRDALQGNVISKKPERAPGRSLCAHAKICAKAGCRAWLC